MSLTTKSLEFNSTQLNLNEYLRAKSLKSSSIRLKVFLIGLSDEFFQTQSNSTHVITCKIWNIWFHTWTVITYQKTKNVNNMLDHLLVLLKENELQDCIYRKIGQVWWTKYHDEARRVIVQTTCPRILVSFSVYRIPLMLTMAFSMPALLSLFGFIKRSRKCD